MINIFIAPTGLHSGLTSISLALLHALDTQGIKAGFFKPVAAYNGNEPERSTHMVKQTYALTPPAPLTLKHAQRLVSQGQKDQLLEDIIGLHYQASKDCDVTIVEGIVPDRSEPYTAKINSEIAKALNADVILVNSAEGLSTQAIQSDIDLNAAIFGGLNGGQIIGALINKLGAPRSTQALSELQNTPVELPTSLPHLEGCPVLGAVPWQQDLTNLRTIDISNQLRLQPLAEGEMSTRRVKNITLCARTLPNMLSMLGAGSLIVTPGDRDDILLACALAETNGTPLAGLVLTGGLSPSDETLKLCQSAIQKGLPILTTGLDTFACAKMLDQSIPRSPAMILSASR